VKCLSYLPERWPLESQFLTGHFLSSMGTDERALISALLDGLPLLFRDIDRAGAFFPVGGVAFVGLDSEIPMSF